MGLHSVHPLLGAYSCSSSAAAPGARDTTVVVDSGSTGVHDQQQRCCGAAEAVLYMLRDCTHPIPGPGDHRRYFKVSERGSTLGNEVKSGVVTFLTMSYILLVNPQILGAAGDLNGGRLGSMWCVHWVGAPGQCLAPAQWVCPGDPQGDQSTTAHMPVVWTAGST